MDFIGTRLVEVSPSSLSFAATVHLTPLPAVAPVEKVAQPAVAATTGTYNYSSSNGTTNGNRSSNYRERSPAPGVSHASYKSPYQPPPSHRPRSYNSGSDKGSYSTHEPQVATAPYHHAGPPPAKVVPGDWTCPARGCESYNYAFRSSCYKCHCPKPQPPTKYSSSHVASGYRHQPAYLSHHSSYQYAPYPQPSQPLRAFGRVGDWLCPNSMCRFENFASRVACLHCGTENPTYKIAPHSIPAPVPVSTNFRQGDWYCPACNSHNFASRYACISCNLPRSDSGPTPMMPPTAERSQQPLLPGDWYCHNNNCGFHNFAKRMSCGRCGAPAGL
ncbi:Asparagine-rich protein (ARP protein) [Massospora cicadina]|nr:Asparagine-rich protein (ARP protein) [Massospora cicadina]